MHKPLFNPNLLDETLQGFAPYLRGGLRTCYYRLMVMVALLPILAIADGKYYGDRAIVAPPTIPVQRALIRWEDGVQTLLVESGVESASPRLGWILPVPAEPTAFDAAEPGLLATMSLALQPHIETGGGMSWLLSAFLLWTVGMRVALYAYLRRRHGNQEIRKVLWESVAILAVYAILSGMLLPTLGKSSGIASGPGVPPSVVVTQVVAVGAYEVQVLQAETADALAAWLAEHGFAAPNAAARSHLDAYIAEGWCFLVAQLQREGEGYSEPHPLAVTFPTPSPIYPMRLTGVDAVPLHLDLIVIGDQPARAPHLERVFSQRMSLSKDMTSLQWYTARVYHPALPEYVADSAWVTRLSGRLELAQMQADLPIIFDAQLGAHREVLYSHRAALLIAGAMALLACTLTALIIGFKQQRVDDPEQRNRLPMKYIATVVLVALGIAAAIYLYLPKGEIVQDSSYRQAGEEATKALADMERSLQELAADGADDATVLATALAELHRKGITNAFTGQPIRAEYSPGNITIHERWEDVRVLSLIERNGQSHMYILLPDAELPDAEPPK